VSSRRPASSKARPVSSARPVSKTAPRSETPRGKAPEKPAETPATALDRPGRLLTDWGPTAARLLLGLVLAWFGYHELIQPAPWTGYVPVVSATSNVAIAAVLAHGWLLLVLAAALIAGVATRVAGGIAALLLFEIVISLTVTGGLSDLTLRDVGVLGLAVMLASGTRQRLALTT
jgi:uncharacterized membrane protein YphA (DoxX/SURF4 family)